MLRNYEDRVRFYSSPEKVFNYFATAEVEGEKLMMPEDLVLSITPSMARGDAQQIPFSFFSSTTAPGAAGTLMGTRVSASDKERIEVWNTSLQDSSALELMDASGDGLISFTEYILCMTLLSLDPADIAMAFNLFDEDQSGTIDATEFVQVMQAIQRNSSFAAGQRLESFSVDQNAKLMAAFFGPDQKRELQLKDLLSFVSCLQDEILMLEFEQAQEDGHLSAEAFIQLLTCHASDPGDYTEPIEESEVTISKEEWRSFNVFLRQVERAYDALVLFRGNVDQLQLHDLKRVYHAVTGLQLRDEIAELLFDAFGAEDGIVDGVHLLRVLQLRKHRFVVRHRDTGFIRTAQCFKSCF